MNKSKQLRFIKIIAKNYNRCLKYYCIFVFIFITIFAFCSCNKNQDSQIKEEVLKNTSTKNLEFSSHTLDKETLENSTGLKNSSDINSKITKEKLDTESDDIILCENKGLVKKPGVYKLKKNSRVNDLILESGGVTDNASTSNINLAKKLVDGEVVIIYDQKTIELKKLELQNNTNDTYSDINSDKNDLSKVNIEKGSIKKININTASQTELQTIPGVGEVTAKNIISYREQNGKFKTIEEIKNVDRIGEKTFLKIENYIKID